MEDLFQMLSELTLPGALVLCAGMASIAYLIRGVLHQQVDALGIVPEVEGHTVYMMLDADGARFVVGDAGCPGDLLVDAISDALGRPRVDF